MADACLAADILNLEYRIQRCERRVNRQVLREIEQPFDLTDVEFRELYRLTPELLNDLIDVLAPHLMHTRITGLSVEKQVLSAIRLYATGCYQRPVGEQWGISMSQPSISRCIHRVTDAINENIFRQWVQFSMTPEARWFAREQFQNAPQPFEGAIGAIDCTHVAILAPREHEEAYVNHNGYHSINVQMICDPTLKILNVNARFPGARHDAYIWSSSAARGVMERAYNRGERRTYLIGDSGYPLEPWLLTPLPHEPEETPRFFYNEALCSARNCVERLFGVLKSTWRCLSKHRVLQYEPGFAGKIVNACAVLHNMRIAGGILDDDPFEKYANGDVPGIHIDDDDNLRPLTLARRIQDRLIVERFGR
ncbi:putative nuclease HARBI1 [Temnothorax curvispinosus]|uniref:Nuclease HARBI1 n=1 Tax=Temnothorax curvispinosus TaxID=300111 RepID=A0A6J1PVU7_9HYME|nr:putative nuclease HARBI1 [Temnothorax curvispinosus]